MRYLSQHPAEFVPADVLTKEAYGPDKGKNRPFAGLMGSFGKRSKNRYGHMKPWTQKWNAVTCQWEYQMTLATGKWIEAL